MKRGFLCLGVLALSGLLCSMTTAKELKVGVLDVERIYANYEKAKGSAAEAEKERKARQAEVAAKQDELKKLQNEYDSKKDKLKDNEKKDYEKKIADKRTEVINFARTVANELNQKSRATIQTRLNEVSQVVQNYAKEKGYDLIIDKKSLPYFSSTFDISEDILKVLNAPKP